MNYDQEFFDVQETKPLPIIHRKGVLAPMAKKGNDGFWTGYAKSAYWSQSTCIRRIMKEVALDDARRLVEALREQNQTNQRNCAD